MGNRRDGTLVKQIDSMHYIMPLMYPDRCDNEAFISETMDLTAVNKYLEKKNAENPEYKYNMFQFIVSVMIKTLTLRYKLNRFYANCSLYQRNEVSAAFTIKKVFKDESDEGLAFIHSKPEFTIEDIHNEIYRQVHYVRKEGKDQSTQSMDAIQKIPGFLKRIIGRGARFLDRHGWMPQSVIATDPFQSSVVLANLGSIKLHAGYHHLTNWGTTSVFVVVGEKKPRWFDLEDGTRELRDSVDLGLTVDERVTDGFYCSRTIQLIRKLFEDPELLDLPFNTPVEY